MPRRTLVSLILFFISAAKCARILAVFPMPSLSHQVVFRPITQELARRGHEVVVITTDPAFPEGQAPANLSEIDIHDVGYKAWLEALKEVVRKPNDLLTQMKTMIKSSAYFFPAEMLTKAVQDVIKKKNGDFDLLLTELCVRKTLGFSHIFNVPLIQISSFGATLYNDGVVGSAVHPLLYPSNSNRRIYNLTILEKLDSLWSDWNLRRYYSSLEDSEHEILKKIFGSDVPPLKELKKNIHMTMLSIHPIWIDNQPIPTSVINIGGIHMKQAKPLSTEIQSYFDRSKNGIIYVSFGTNAMPSEFGPEIVKVLLGVLSSLPYDVLLKWDQDKLPFECKNIKISKWFPQSDILRHPKVKLFITQGGLQSTEESIIAGVPLLGIPVLGDQWYNCEKIVHHKIGMKLEMTNLNAEALRNSIEMIINDQSYRNNVRRFGNIFNDQPQTPLERAIWWIEYVIRHKGAKHLRPPTANMSLYEYLEMDLVIFIILALFVASLTVFLVTFVTWRYVQVTFLKCKKIKDS